MRNTRKQGSNDIKQRGCGKRQPASKQRDQQRRAARKAKVQR